MKWLPPPRVPSWMPILAFTLLCTAALLGSLRSRSQSRAAVVASGWALNPAGTAAATASSAPLRSSGSCDAVCGVRTAVIPQPKSTPTAAGMMAASVGITDPMVAPMPTWASAIKATGPDTAGLRAVRWACTSVSASASNAQLTTERPAPASTVTGPCPLIA